MNSSKNKPLRDKAPSISFPSSSRLNIVFFLQSGVSKVVRNSNLSLSCHINTGDLCSTCKFSSWRHQWVLQPRDWDNINGIRCQKDDEVPYKPLQSWQNLPQAVVSSWDVPNTLLYLTFLCAAGIIFTLHHWALITLTTCRGLFK